MTRIFLSLCCAVCGYLALGVLGVNRDITLNTSTPFGEIAVWSTAVIVGGLALFDWFGPRRDIYLPYAIERLKRDRFGLSIVVGLAYTVLASSAAAWTANALTGVLAQHSSGSIGEASGKVVSIHRVNAPRSLCRVNVSVASQGMTESLRFCLATTFGEPVGPVDFRGGDRVIVRTNKNRFGLVVTSIEHDRSIP